MKKYSYLWFSFMLYMNAQGQEANLCLSFLDSQKQTAIGAVADSTASKTFAISFRYKSVMPKTNDMPRMLCWNDDSAGTRIEFGFTQGCLSGYLYHSKANYQYQFKLNTPTHDGAWHSMAFVQYDGYWQVYSDGSIYLTETGQLKPGRQLLLGGWYGQEYFTGAIDDVLLTRGEIWPPQVQQLHKGLIPSDLPKQNWIAYYNCNQGTVLANNKHITTLLDHNQRNPLSLRNMSFQGIFGNFISNDLYLKPDDRKTETLAVEQYREATYTKQLISDVFLNIPVHFSTDSLFEKLKHPGLASAYKPMGGGWLSDLQMSVDSFQIASGFYYHLALLPHYAQLTLLSEKINEKKVLSTLKIRLAFQNRKEMLEAMNLMLNAMTQSGRVNMQQAPEFSLDLNHPDDGSYTLVLRPTDDDNRRQEIEIHYFRNSK